MSSVNWHVSDIYVGEPQTCSVCDKAWLNLIGWDSCQNNR